MSDPLSEVCIYCGSPDVLDDAWWCYKPLCGLLAQRDEREEAELEERLPLSRIKCYGDMLDTKACVWGTPYLEIEHAIERLLVCVYVRRVSHVAQII